MGKFSVVIVLAVYNGSAYIDELIESILSQSYPPAKIYIGDDDSTDDTYDKLQGYAEQFSQVIVMAHDKNIGVVENFEALLQQANNDYIMLADQDDYWLTDKVSLSIEGLKKIEYEFGSDIPTLFFTDLQVVDQNLKNISDSFWGYENIQPEVSQLLNKLIVRNVSPGCAMIFNRALLKKALPFPKGVMMHDWWLILVAVLFGNVGYSSESTIKYRQHDKNVEGAKKNSIYRKVYNLIFHYQNIQRIKNQTQFQAKLLLDRFSGEMKGKDREILKAYSNSRKENKLMHKYRCYENGISSNGLLSNLGLYLII